MLLRLCDTDHVCSRSFQSCANKRCGSHIHDDLSELGVLSKVLNAVPDNCQGKRGSQIHQGIGITKHQRSIYADERYQCLI